MLDAAIHSRSMPTAGSAAAIAAAGLVALAVAMGIGRFAFTPILPMMQAELGLTVAQSSWLASANYVGYLAGALSAIALRIRPPVAIRAGLLLIAATTAAMAVDQPLPTSIALRAVAGVASAWVLVFVSEWSLERLARLRRLDLSGAIYAGVGAGIIVAGIACAVIAAMSAGSATAWIALGVLSLVATIVIWPWVDNGSKASHARTHPAMTMSSMPDKRAWRLVLCYGAFGFGYIVPATFLPLMAKSMVADPRWVGLAWPLFGAAAAVSTLVAMRLARTVAMRTLWSAGHLIMALGVVMPLVLPGLAGVVASALLVGGTFMVVTMTGLQVARASAGPDARVLLAAMTSAFATGQIAGPLTVGMFGASTNGFAAALLIAAAVLALAAVALLRARTTSADTGPRGV